MKRYIYLISPQKIRGLKFYKELNKVLKTNKIKYFQLRLKKTSISNLLKISKKVKKIVKRNNVKFIINDKPLVAKMVGANGCHIGQKDVDFIFVDLHGEITSEKMALSHFLDGKVSAIVGTHTHVPTMDFQILNKGTAYQTDIGMCGDYDSVIGMNKFNSIKKFLKDPSATRHYPALGEATISGLMVNCDKRTGLAKKVSPIILGGKLDGLLS